MAQFTFDTNDPDDVKLLNRLVSAGLITSPDADGNFDLTGAVDSLLSSLGEPARELVMEFMFQTEFGATTLATVATKMDIPESEAKSRKMGLGRSIKRVQREFPGMLDPIPGALDKSLNHQTYTMDAEVREAMAAWFAARGRDYTTSKPITPATTVATDIGVHDA